MMNDDDLVPVAQFIAESERNLEIANAIYLQYENAREAIVKTFFARLTADLKPKLEGWSCRYTESFFLAKWGAFDIFKKEWKGRYTIRLEAYEYGESMGYGVWRDADALVGVPLGSEILRVVREHFPRAGSRSYYEAEIAMTSPAGCWKTPKILWRMQSDDTFRSEVAELLLQLVAIAEEHVDALAKTGGKVN
jgi:hypothetical protein